MRYWLKGKWTPLAFSIIIDQRRKCFSADILKGCYILMSITLRYSLLTHVAYNSKSMRPLAMIIFSKHLHFWQFLVVCRVMWISSFPSFRFSGRCRNLEFTITNGRFGASSFHVWKCISTISVLHSGYLHGAPSSPLPLRGAPDYSTDTVSELHAEAHRQL